MLKKYNILIVDDEPDVLDIFDVVIEGIENCELFTAINLPKAIDIVKLKPINLAIIDVVLGGTDGYTVCKTLREMANASEAYFILMSSDKYHLIDRIKAFNVGAQEFLSKPFDLKEVELIIRSKINFVNKIKTEERASTEDFIHTAGKFLIDDRFQNLVVGEQAISLSAIEYNILKFFIKNYEKIISVEDINIEVWDNCTTPENVRSVIHRIRTKIEVNPNKPLYIVNAKGSGYIFYPTGDPPTY
jgi:DNA-binding response OmpR family regulator